MDLRFELRKFPFTMKNEFLQVEKVGLNDPAFLEKKPIFLHKRASDPKFLVTKGQLISE